MIISWRWTALPTAAATSPADYDVATVHVSNYGAELSPETDSSQFYYEGYTSMKKSTSRKFKPVGKRLMGDAFQDFICSHAIKYGKGSDVVRDYVYFCVLTGKGEKGKVLILVNNDGAAESGAIGDIDVELRSSVCRMSIPTPLPDCEVNDHGGNHQRAPL